MRGLFDGEHGFRVVPEDVGRCRFEHFETFSGAACRASHVGVRSGDHAQGFEAMNRALKTRAESN